MNPTDTTTKNRRWLVPATAAAILLLLALTPPYLNVNRLQRRIAASMSATLGRPVHLDRVTLHLLPLPGLTLENLVVSEDPAFGSEPVIRANRVEITLRLSSLWRRKVELASIRFAVDDQGSGPSLNLVRNPDGRWNLQSLLMHAAEATGAPPTPPGASSTPGAPFMRDASSAHEWGSTTASTTANTTTPHFPYIEATGARVNIKLGNEKKPFSLTDTDFALWLPDPTTWHVRLEGKPARTDLNISDPGTLHLEGTLQRAAVMSEVPVNLTATWQGAPLGEASLLVSGNDAGWRGKLTLDAHLTGPLGHAQLTTRAHLQDLRRADFVPAHTLDLLATCASAADITSAVLTSPACKLTSPNQPALQLSAVADTADLSRLTQPAAITGLTIGSPALPTAFLLDAARLFSQRIPPTGPANLPATVLLTTTPDGLNLGPLDLTPHNPPLLLTGTLTTAGYTLHLTGPATPTQLTTLIQAMPPLADNLPAPLPEKHLDLTCTRTWHTPQTCTQSTPEPPKKRHHH